MGNLPDAKSFLTPSAICTLFESDYHFGLAAFINSLVRAGYKGTVWAGYRGSLPPWLAQLRQADEEGTRFLVNNQVELAFVPLTTSVHLTNYKPTFMLDLLAHRARGCEYLWYFDPDIWLISKWSFFEGWQRGGIALCQELINNSLPDDSPLRMQWRETAASIGVTSFQKRDHYYNGGMVGVPAACTNFLRVWKRLIEVAEASGHDLSVMISGDRDMPFLVVEQDALNIATMCTDFSLSTLGPEGMGFLYGTSRMYHSVGLKPWRGSLLWRALRGMPPSNATKFFFTQAQSPIRAYSWWRLRAKRLECSIGALMGRFYRRQ